MHIFLFAAALITSIAPVQSSAPNRQPQIAATSALTAVVFGSGPSIWVSTSPNGGTSFRPPVKVAQVPGLALGRHRGPRIVIAGDVLVVTAVVGQGNATGPHAHGQSTDGNLLSWRSVDGGRTWSEPVVVNDVASSAREGLHSFAVSPTGELAAVCTARSRPIAERRGLRTWLCTSLREEQSASAAIRRSSLPVRNARK
jgi:hypothetical protein